MDFSIDFAGPLQNQIRRISRLRLRAAAALLQDMPDGAAPAVHGARKHIKQVRALYRLVADCAPDFQRDENKRLGDIARELSHLRDATALVEVTDYLKHQIGSKSNAMLMDRLAKRLDHRRQRLTASAADASDMMRKAMQDLEDAANDADRLTLPNDPRKSGDCVVAGWERVSRKARQAISAAATGAHDEAFHDLRKRGQDRWMHAALMRNLWPTAMVAMQRQAKELADLLGHMQDLSVLQDTIAGAPELVPDNVENEAIRDAIRSQQSRLGEECLELGHDLFRKSRPGDGKMIRHLIHRRAAE